MARARRCLRAVVQSQVSRKDCIDALVRSMIFVWALALTGLALGAHLVSQPRKAKQSNPPSVNWIYMDI